MGSMIVRNMRLYFRDRVAVFFSLLSVLITIALYVFFLSDTILSGGFAEMKEASQILDLWLLGGLLSITCVTAPLAVYGVMVQDQYKLITKDFYATSFPQWKLMLSYIIAAMLSGIVICIFTMIVGFVFIVGNGGTLPSVEVIFTIFGGILLCVGAGSSLTYFIASFLHSASAFSNASVMVGTSIGFLMGIYVPIGALPSFAQNIVRFFPITQGCAMFRSILLETPLETAFQGIDVQLVNDLKTELGVTLTYGDVSLPVVQNAWILIVCAIVIFIISLALNNVKKQKK